MDDTIRTRLLVCLLAIACIYVILLTTPAYFRVHGGTWNDGTFEVPAGKSVFTMVQFADLHYGEHESSDAKSTQVMQGVLRDEPEVDLVVFSGDQVSGYVIANPRETLRKWTEPMRVVNALQIPFVSMFGNHDDQALHTGHVIQYKLAQILLVLALAGVVLIACRRDYPRLPRMVLAIMAALSLVIGFAPTNVMRRSLLHYEHGSFQQFSYSREGPADVHGLGNYYVRVRHGDQVVLVFLLDSGGGRLEETYTDKQIQWVRLVAGYEQAEAGIAFGHIPPVDFRTALVDLDRFSCIGYNHTENVMPAAQESLPLMAELDKAGIKALFSGHDHRDSYCCVPKTGVIVNSPAMCYGRHTGYGGYGDWMRGARVIQLDFSARSGNSPVIWTWLRMEDGTQRELVMLYPV